MMSDPTAGNGPAAAEAFATPAAAAPHAPEDPAGHDAVAAAVALSRPDSATGDGRLKHPRNETPTSLPSPPPKRAAAVVAPTADHAAPATPAPSAPPSASDAHAADTVPAPLAPAATVVTLDAAALRTAAHPADAPLASTASAPVAVASEPADTTAKLKVEAAAGAAGDDASLAAADAAGDDASLAAAVAAAAALSGGIVDPTLALGHIPAPLPTIPPPLAFDAGSETYSPSASTQAGSPDPAASDTASSGTPGGNRARVRLHRCYFPGCGKTFTRRFNLQSHELVHSETRPFSCKQCTFSFRRKHDLDRHTRSLHTAVRSFICPKCQHPFARSDALRRHREVEDRRDQERAAGKGPNGTSAPAAVSSAPVPVPPTAAPAAAPPTAPAAVAAPPPAPEAELSKDPEAMAAAAAAAFSRGVRLHDDEVHSSRVPTATDGPGGAEAAPRTPVPFGPEGSDA